jgi:fused signal recognition particle receptor
MDLSSFHVVSGASISMSGLLPSLGALVASALSTVKEYCPSSIEKGILGLGGVLCVVVLYLALRSIMSAEDSGRLKRDKGTLPGERELHTGQASDSDSAPHDQKSSSSGDLLFADRCEPHTDSVGKPMGPEAQREEAYSVFREQPAIQMGEEPESKFLERLRIRLAKTQDQLFGRLDRILSSKTCVGVETLEELEEVLVTADLGVITSQQLLSEIKTEMTSRGMEADRLREILKRKLKDFLSVECGPLEPSRARPFVIMVVGVNGVGKTTTIGKLAARFQNGGHKVMLVAADTFRAAAIEQLEIWSKRVGTDFVKQKPGADPSAVAYDAVRAAISRKTDIMIIDTAGRLHTKLNLLEELKKVKRILGRELEGAPHEVLLVLDSTTGQNSIQQARVFYDALRITGIVLTKMDGTAKGGVIIGISNELQLPVRFIGIGEQVDDLREFDPRFFLDAIFEKHEI